MVSNKKESVVVKCWADVITLLCAEVPGAAERWLVVDKDLTASWAHGSGINIVGPKEGIPCGRFGGVCCQLEQVKGEFCLWEKEIVLVHREGGHSASQDVMKWSLNVHIAHSAAFRRWIWGGTSWNMQLLAWMACREAVLASLSRTWWAGA